LISEHEDVIPLEISTACQGTTVETTQMIPPVCQFYVNDNSDYEIDTFPA